MWISSGHASSVPPAAHKWGGQWFLCGRHDILSTVWLVRRCFFSGAETFSTRVEEKTNGKLSVFAVVENFPGRLKLLRRRLVFFTHLKFICVLILFINHWIISIFYKRHPEKNHYNRWGFFLVQRRFQRTWKKKQNCTNGKLSAGEMVENFLKKIDKNLKNKSLGFSYTFWIYQFLNFVHQSLSSIFPKRHPKKKHYNRWDHFGDVFRSVPNAVGHLGDSLARRLSWGSLAVNDQSCRGPHRTIRTSVRT